MALLTDSLLLDFLIVNVVLLIVAYLLYKRRYNYWKNRGVPGPEPTLVFGNMLEIATKKLSLGVFLKSIYDRTKEHPFVGVYLMHRPALILNDPELIKSVIIRDFSHFTDRGISFDAKTQPLTNNPFTTTGTRWKRLRNKLTPAFTSNKMKWMFDIIVSCGDELKKHLEEFANSGIDVDVKETVAKYTTDAIACCAFGIESNCFKYPNAEIRVMGRKIATFSLRRNLTIILMLCAPDIQKIINSEFIEKPLADFFIKLVGNTIKHREKNGIVRNDLMQLLIRLKNNESIEDNDADKETKDEEIPDIQLDDVGIAAQAFVFFFAGFDATSTTMTFVLHEISKNPEVKKKLMDEIDEVLAKHDNKITYESVNEMTYLTQVIEETLRLHSTAPQLLRICTKEYVIPGTDKVINKGTPVMIPIMGLHMDPKYYPNPEKFDPENFSNERKASRSHMSFLAFGEGPRMCIGMRFAMMQVRVGVVSILQNYDVGPPKEKVETEQTYNAIFVVPNVHLQLKSRKVKSA